MSFRARVQSIHQLFLVVFFLTLAVSVLAACSRSEQEVSFTILAEGQSLRQTSINDISTQVFILSNTRDVQALMRRQQFSIPPDVLNDALGSMFNALSNIDYQQNIGLLILYGMDGSKGYDFRIKDIRNDEGEITVYVSSLTHNRWYDFLFGEKVENMTKNDPYKALLLPHSHLVSPHNSVTFNLVLDGSLVDQQEIVMPYIGEQS